MYSMKDIKLDDSTIRIINIDSGNTYPEMVMVLNMKFTAIYFIHILGKIYIMAYPLIEEFHKSDGKKPSAVLLTH